MPCCKNSSVLCHFLTKCQDTGNVSFREVGWWLKRRWEDLRHLRCSALLVDKSQGLSTSKWRLPFRGTQLWSPVSYVSYGHLSKLIPRWSSRWKVCPQLWDSSGTLLLWLSCTAVVRCHHSNVGSKVVQYNSVEEKSNIQKVMNWVESGEKFKVEMRRSAGGSLSAANQCLLVAAALTHTKEDFLPFIGQCLFEPSSPIIGRVLQMVEIRGHFCIRWIYIKGSCAGEINGRRERCVNLKEKSEPGQLNQVSHPSMICTLCITVKEKFYNSSYLGQRTTCPLTWRPNMTTIRETCV